MYKITKEFMFSMAHMLEGHGGQCLNLHGHDYKLQITVRGMYCPNDMLLDFSDLKETVKDIIIDKLDHSFAYKIDSTDKAENEIVKILKQNGRRTFGFPFRPTAENMSQYIFNLLKMPLKSQIYQLDCVKLYETPTSFAEYYED